MKVRFFCDSGANAYSAREEVVDLFKDLQISDEEWLFMSWEEQQKEVENWAYDRLEIG